MRVIESNGVYAMLDEYQGIMAAANRAEGKHSWSYWRKEPFKKPEHVHWSDNLDINRVRKIFAQSQLKFES